MEEGHRRSDGEREEESSLLYRMATAEEFLRPLRTFQKRRLYANLNGDFVVPLGTAAFLNAEMVQTLRERYAYQFGILTTIITTVRNYSDNCNRQEGKCDPLDNEKSSRSNGELSADDEGVASRPESDCMRSLPLFQLPFQYSDDSVRTFRSCNVAEREMRTALDSVGWEKVLVHFNSALPLSHNKICALNKYPSWLNSLLGFQDGRFVMDNASQWLLH